MEDFLYAVEVEGEWGCPNNKVKTKLQIYFQSKKKSNGGDCVVECNEVTGRFIVRFKSEEVRRKVLEKTDHETTIENKEVKLRVKSSASATPAEPPQAEGETNKASGSGSQADGDLPEGARGSPQQNAVVFKNVQENFSEEMLVLMVENVSDVSESDFSLEIIYERQTAVVSFRNANDATQFLLKCGKNNRFQQSRINARLLEHTRSVRVENLPPQVSEDMLELYFERKKEGGGEIKAIKMIPEEQAAIVTFLDPEVAETIRGKKHRILQVPMKVYPFYESIGAALYGKDRPKWKLPDPFTESIHPAVRKFLLQKNEIATINKEMRNHYCEVHLDTSDVKLTPLPTLLKQKGLSVKHIDNWKKNVTDTFQNILTKYKTFERDVNYSVWTVAEKEISLAAKQDVILLYDQSNGVLTVAGLVQDVDRLKPVVEGTVQKVTNQMERATQSISEELDVPPSMFYILQQDGLQQKARSYPEMTCAYKPDIMKLVLSGLPLEVFPLKSWIFEHQLKMKRKQLEVEPEILGFLSSGSSEEMSAHLFTSHGIAAVYRVEDISLVLTGTSDSALADAQAWLRNALTFQNIAIKDPALLSRPEWQMLHKKLKETYNSSKKNTVTIKFTAQDMISVSGFRDDVKEVYESLSDFLNKYTHVQEAIQVQSAAVIQFIQEKKVQNWKAFLGSKDVEVFFELKRKRIKLNGAQYSVQEVKHFFQKIVNALHVDFLKIVKPGAKKYFLEKHSIFHTMIMKDTNCMVVLQEDMILEETEEELGSLSTYCKVQMPNGLIITVAKADLCKFQADVVVNASNESLQHIGGLALALLRAAGPQLQTVCDLYKNRNGDVKPGDAIITEAGQLPCRYVIHAVGPRFSEWDRSSAVRLLRRAVRQALNLAMEKGCHSVAIPAISSGIFGFPLDLCAETIAGVVREHCEDHIPGKSSLSEIHLVNHDEKTTQAMTDAVKTVFAGPHLQLMLPRNSPSFLESANRKKPALNDDQSSRKAKRGELLEKMHTAEGLRICLRTGNIQDAATTVIVNTISEDLNLKKGAVSQAILSAAGPQIQSAVHDKVRKSTLEHGSMVVTDGYGLKCEQVFHTVCPFWDNGSGKSEQILITIIQECLRAAEKQKMESISIPALGTGSLGFPKDLVAKLLLSEVQTYSRRHGPKHLSEVDFVLHPRDSGTIDCFRRQFGDHRHSHKGQYRQHEEFPQAAGPTNPVQKGSGFFSQISTPSLGVYTMHVGTLMLEVSSGDITKQNTDAIVNSSNDSFTLKTGVSKAVLMKAGFAVEEDCKRLGSQPHKGYIITQPGQLSCKNIIHIVGQTDPNKIKEMVYKVLQVCEEKRFASVSLPAIGTGAGGVNPSLVADAMINAVVDFENKKKGQYLKCVKIVVFQAGMMGDFHRSLKMKEGTVQPEDKSVFTKIKETLTSVFGGTSVRPGVDEDFTIVGEEFAPAIFHFCGESLEEVSKAKNYVQDLIMKEQMEHTIKDQCISFFTPEDCETLLNLQKQLTVSIHLEKRGANSLIRLEGLSRDVLTANDIIKEMMRKVENLERRKREAALVGAIVEWQHDASGTFLPFDSFTNLTLEQAFDSHSANVKIIINNLEYMADLSSKEAVHGKKIIKLIRRELNAVTEDLPVNWDDMRGSELLEVTLGTSSAEYQQVQTKFRKTGLNNNIIKIVRIQNNTLWKSYQIKKAGMDNKNKHSNNEKLLFHGTCASTISHINTHGFNRSYAGKNAAAIGNGTYFAVDPKYSASDTYSKPDAQRHKNMYLARVLVGDYTQGSGGLLVPPAKAAGNVSDLYDSVVDNVSRPQMFVIFNDVQAYPEYLITFS